MSYVFGPVPSRRLGMSLGVDLIPLKTCTFDCIYCQVGRTTSKISVPDRFLPVRDVIFEIEKKLRKTTPDAITLAGSGEPTLHSEIDRVIGSIKDMTDIRVALLTNGSLFWKAEVRKRVLMADVIMPTLTTVSDRTFKLIHRAHHDLDLHTIIDGLISLRDEYRGQIFLELVFLSGFNDSESEVHALKEVVEQIRPEKIQINTVVRPPADRKAISIDKNRLEELKELFGERSEIIAGTPVGTRQWQRDTLSEDIIEMVKRRPLRIVDISMSLGMPGDEIEPVIKGLLIKGYIIRQEHLGEIYYSGNE